MAKDPFSEVKISLNLGMFRQMAEHKALGHFLILYCHHASYIVLHTRQAQLCVNSEWCVYTMRLCFGTLDALLDLYQRYYRGLHYSAILQSSLLQRHHAVPGYFTTKGGSFCLAIGYQQASKVV